MTERRSKYNAVITKRDGYTFRSKAEARRWPELQLLEKAGTIIHLRVAPRFRLIDGGRDRDGNVIRPIDYIGDFDYYEGSQWVVEDVKGKTAKLTDVFAIKSKLFRLKYKDIDFRIVRM